MYKILHTEQVKEINLEIPQEVEEELTKIAHILDQSYGKDRQEHDLGGYILLLTNKEDISILKHILRTLQLDMSNLIAEFVDEIKCRDSAAYTSSLILLSSDYSISLIMPKEITPKALLDEIE